LHRGISGEKYIKGKKGLTLLELIVSIALLSIALLSFGNLLSSSLAATVQAGRVTQAASLAQERMETLLSCSLDELCAQETAPDGVLIPLDGFDRFRCSQIVREDSLVLGSYQIDGLRLEVEIALDEGRELAKFVTFVRRGGDEK
jgi:prepilin-type N-terminal cleavage/methylation domain-containing protein